MTGELIYLDTSAFIRLLVEDEQSESVEVFLTKALSDGNELVSSDLLRLEMSRIAIRDDNEPLLEFAGQQLESVSLIDVDRAVMDAACILRPHAKSLDAIHIATALRISPSYLLTFDKNMTAVARANGLEAGAPSEVTRQ